MDYRIYPMELSKLKLKNVYEAIIKCVDANRSKRYRTSKEKYKMEKSVLLDIQQQCQQSVRTR